MFHTEKELQLIEILNTWGAAMNFATDQTAGWKKKPFQESYIIKTNLIYYYYYCILLLFFTFFFSPSANPD